ncbi:MAG: lipid A deacylase LpxR family protein [Bacteroidota bacterium]
MRYCLLLVVFGVTQVVAQDKLVRFNYDNDYFSATDRYYTQGVRLEIIAPAFQKLSIPFLLIKQKNSTSSFAGIAIERDGFTPTGIRIDSIPIGNRPYAATMFLSNFSIEMNEVKHTRITSQIDIGIMGPAVGGKEEQKGIHYAIGDLLPLGWQYQIANDLILKYTAIYEKGLLNKNYIMATGFTQGRLGTLYTDACVGTMLRVGFMNNYFSNLGITKQANTKKFQLYGFVKASGKVVGYNATMQGGLFSNSIYTLPSSSINRLVGQAFLGVVVAYKRFQLEYTKTYLSQEYSNGLTHGWGHCNISFCF